MGEEETIASGRPVSRAGGDQRKTDAIHEDVEVAYTPEYEVDPASIERVYR